MDMANGPLFRADEMVILSHYDKREGKWIETASPKFETTFMSQVLSRVWRKFWRQYVAS